MNGRPDRHLSREEISELGAGCISEIEKIQLQPHLDACASCSEALMDFREQWTEYLHFHQQVLKPALPCPPQPWAALERPTAVASGWRRVGWWSAAAAVIVTAVVLHTLNQPAPVNTAELLQKASAAEVPAHSSPAWIRIAARGRSWIRPALLNQSAGNTESATERELRQKFEAAGYSWQNPVSAKSFSAWRNRLRERRDEVTRSRIGDPAESVYEVRTSTDDGELRQATLSLRENDLLPVACQWEFRDEVVNMAEVSPAAVSGSSRPVASPPSPAPGDPPAGKPVGPGEELRVLAALHRIDADLGEEITVTRGPKEIIVRGFGLDARRRDQVTQALAGLNAVVLDVDQAPAGSVSAPAEKKQPRRGESGRISLLYTEIETRLGGETSAEELIDEVLQASDNALARAFALRSLAGRFNPEIESQLAAEDGALLTSLLQDHARALSRELERMRRVMEPVYTGAPEPQPQSQARAPATWQEAAVEVLNCSRSLDQLLNQALAGSGDASVLQLRESMLEFQSVLSSYHRFERH